MSNIAMGIGLGFLAGVLLFLILAMTGVIDKWTESLERRFRKN